jgi:hypothetical protein
MEQPMKVMKMPKMKKEKSTKPRMENLWVNFLKDYAKSNGITYSCALSDPRAKDEYKMMKMPKKEETPMVIEMPKKTRKKVQKMDMVVEPVMVVEMPKKTRKKKL